eukprot:COSAG04_NODE_4660_length_1961_cov_1.544039_5_plen_26_part_01
MPTRRASRIIVLMSNLRKNDGATPDG